MITKVWAIVNDQEMLVNSKFYLSDLAARLAISDNSPLSVAWCVRELELAERI